MSHWIKIGNEKYISWTSLSNIGFHLVDSIVILLKWQTKQWNKNLKLHLNFNNQEDNISRKFIMIPNQKHFPYVHSFFIQLFSQQNFSTYSFNTVKPKRICHTHIIIAWRKQIQMFFELNKSSFNLPITPFILLILWLHNQITNWHGN